MIDWMNQWVDPLQKCCLKMILVTLLANTADDNDTHASIALLEDIREAEKQKCWWWINDHQHIVEKKGHCWNKK